MFRLERWNIRTNILNQPPQISVVHKYIRIYLTGIQTLQTHVGSNCNWERERETPTILFCTPCCKITIDTCILIPFNKSHDSSENFLSRPAVLHYNQNNRNNNHELHSAWVVSKNRSKQPADVEIKALNQMCYMYICTIHTLTHLWK